MSAMAVAMEYNAGRGSPQEHACLSQRKVRAPPVDVHYPALRILRATLIIAIVELLGSY